MQYAVETLLRAAAESFSCHTTNAEDGELHISLTKLEQGNPWPSVIKGHEVDPVTQQQEQQRLMLERFQREVSSTAGVCAVGMALVAGFAAGAALGVFG